MNEESTMSDYAYYNIFPILQMPKIFHVNWFRVGNDGNFLWPGFGDNIRVIDWMCKRIEGQDVADKSPVGWVPKKGNE